MSGREMSHGKNNVIPAAPKTHADQDTETGSCSRGRGSPLTSNAEIVSRAKVATAEIRGRPMIFETWSLELLICVQPNRTQSSFGKSVKS